jgi:hypothetical protein
VATPQLAPDETPTPSAGSTAEPAPAPLAGTEFGPS